MNTLEQRYPKSYVTYEQALQLGRGDVIYVAGKRLTILRTYTYKREKGVLLHCFGVDIFISPYATCVRDDWFKDGWRHYGNSARIVYLGVTNNRRA